MNCEVIDCIDAGTEYCPCVIKGQQFRNTWRVGDYFFLSPTRSLIL